MICQIYTPHKCGIFVVNWRGANYIPNCTVLSRHRCSRLTRKINWQCMSRKKYHCPLVLPHYTCHLQRVVHFPNKCTLWLTIEVPCVFELLRNSNMAGVNCSCGISLILMQILKKPNTCEIVIHYNVMAFWLIAFY